MYPTGARQKPAGFPGHAALGGMKLLSTELWLRVAKSKAPTPRHVTIFGDRVESESIRLDPNLICLVSLQEEDIWTQTHTGNDLKTQGEDSHRQASERGLVQTHPHGPRKEATPCQHLDLKLRASKKKTQNQNQKNF